MFESGVQLRSKPRFPIEAFGNDGRSEAENQRRRTMTRVFWSVLALILLDASVHAADKIKIGYPDASATFLSLPLGQKAGFFQKEGIQADLIRIRSTVALTRLVSGELDYPSVPGPAVAAAIRGVPIKIVACSTPRVATAII